MIYTIQVSSVQEWSTLKSFFPISHMLATPFGEAFSQIINNIECVFFYGGSSKTKSAASCQFAIDKWKPQRHFVIGTAGGVADNLKELDIVIANKTALYDFINRMGETYEFIPVETVVNIDNSWFDFSKLSGNVSIGFIASADQDVDFELRTKLKNENILAADWESGAVSIICYINKIPCCIIRGITDIPIDASIESSINQGSDYLENTPLVMKKIINEILFNII